MPKKADGDEQKSNTSIIKDSLVQKYSMTEHKIKKKLAENEFKNP